MPNLSVTLEDFDQAFRVLNEMLEKTGQIIEVRAVGGFAMLYHGLRDFGYTMDADTVTADYSDEIAAYIRKTAEKLDLDEDWLNNDAYYLQEVSAVADKLKWNEVKRYSNIRLYIADTDSLILLKARAIHAGGLIPRATDKSDLLELLNFVGVHNIDEVRADPHTKQILAYDRCYKFLEELKNW